MAYNRITRLILWLPGFVCVEGLRVQDGAAKLRRGLVLPGEVENRQLRHGLARDADLDARSGTGAGIWFLCGLCGRRLRRPVGERHYSAMLSDEALAPDRLQREAGR